LSRAAWRRARPDQRDAVPDDLAVERVIPLSLIANELLTNGVKHAPPDRDLAIEVSLQRAGDLIRFSVLTKNVKLPADFDVANSGLGPSDRLDAGPASSGAL